MAKEGQTENSLLLKIYIHSIDFQKAKEGEFPCPRLL